MSKRLLVLAGHEDPQSQSIFNNGPDAGNREVGEIEALFALVAVPFTSSQQLFADLLAHRNEIVEVHVDSAIDMIAALKGVDRSSVLRTAISTWFYHALGFRILEAECQEQPNAKADAPADQLSFRVRLDANHEREVAGLLPGQALSDKYRDALVAILPEDLAKKANLPTEQMVEIAWTAPGSVELGGAAAAGLVALMVMAAGLGMLYMDLGQDCGSSCPCVGRSGNGRSEGQEYRCVLRELKERGAEFRLRPDGSVSLRVPPYQNATWRYQQCMVL